MRLLFKLVLLKFIVTSMGCAQHHAYQPPKPSPDVIDLANSNKNQQVLKIISKPSPEYPVRALSSYQPGWVLVQFDVSEEGSTKNIEVMDSSPKNLFEDAAIRAVSQWKFEYKEKTNKLVKVQQLFKFDFEDPYKNFEFETITLDQLKRTNKN